jgi:hypothetical protein
MLKPFLKILILAVCAVALCIGPAYSDGGANAGKGYSKFTDPTVKPFHLLSTLSELNGTVGDTWALRLAQYFGLVEDDMKDPTEYGSYSINGDNFSKRMDREAAEDKKRWAAEAEIDEAIDSSIDLIILMPEQSKEEKTVSADALNANIDRILKNR